MSEEATKAIVECFDVDRRYANFVHLGWVELVGRTMTRMREVCPYVQFRQIKDKRGGDLCIYYTRDGIDQKTQELLDALTWQASIEACTTCMVCSRFGNLIPSERFERRVLCENCHVKQ